MALQVLSVYVQGQVGPRTQLRTHDYPCNRSGTLTHQPNTGGLGGLPNPRQPAPLNPSQPVPPSHNQVTHQPNTVDSGGCAAVMTPFMFSVMHTPRSSWNSLGPARLICVLCMCDAGQMSEMGGGWGSERDCMCDLENAWGCDST